MTGEEKVHGSFFPQGSQPLTSSFQRLRVQVCKILRSTTDSGETWFTLSQTWVWRDGLTQFKWCTLSKFKTIPSLLVHNIYLSVLHTSSFVWILHTSSFVWVFNMKKDSCLNVCILLRWCPPACLHYCCCLFSSRFRTRMTCIWSHWPQHVCTPFALYTIQETKVALYNKKLKRNVGMEKHEVGCRIRNWRRWRMKEPRTAHMGFIQSYRQQTNAVQVKHTERRQSSTFFRLRRTSAFLGRKRGTFDVEAAISSELVSEETEQNG